MTRLTSLNCQISTDNKDFRRALLASNHFTIFYFRKVIFFSEIKGISFKNRHKYPCLIRYYYLFL